MILKYIVIEKKVVIRNPNLFFTIANNLELKLVLTCRQVYMEFAMQFPKGWKLPASIHQQP